MSDKDKSKLKTKRKPGGQVKQGGYAILAKVGLKADRKRIEAYLSAFRMAVIVDIGPTENDLSAAEIVLIDKLVFLLGVTRLIEEKVKKDGVFKGSDLTASLGQHYISYINTIRLTLDKLGLHKKVGDEQGGLTQAYIDEKYGDKEKKK